MADEPQFEGKVLKNKYRVGKRLGQGGMGTVWAAVHELTGRKLAIKILAARLTDQKTIVERFGREARAASAVNHPGIVEVLDLDRTSDGTPFLVMERLEGETLADRLDRRPRLPPDEVTMIVGQLLEALDAAHAHGVVHRDLKPENIVISRRRGGSESVKLLDFGISAKEDERVSELTLEGSVLGTPHYMAPEQALGESSVDGRADLYSIGVLIFECLAGDVPFDAPNYNRLIHTILHNTPPPLPEDVRPGVPEPLKALMGSLLKKDPSHRPQTARQALEIMAGDALPAAMESQGEFLDFPTEGFSGDPVFADSDPAPGAPEEPAGLGGLELDEDALSSARKTRDPATPLSLDAAAVGRGSHAGEAPLSPNARPGPASATSGEQGHTSTGRMAAVTTGRMAAVSTGRHGAATPADPPEKKRSRAGVLLLVLALVAAGAGGWYLWPSFQSSEVAPAPASALPQSPSVAADKAPPRREREQTVSVSVRNLPAGARLYLDGIPVGSPPLRLRRGEEERRLRIEATGHDSRTISVRPTMDLRVNGYLRVAGSRLR